MSESTVTCLRAVRARLATPDKWTKGALARKADGNAVNPHDQDAVCWCLSGAMLVEAEELGEGSISGFENVIYRTTHEITGSFDYVLWQDRDNRTHAEVLALIDRAIQLAEATR
ncbi:MAG: hypothetical protein JWQ89_4573 [Devosia sp.]|nr:hypothetical protein [Devosia sp.]